MDALYGFCLTSQVIGSARKIDAFIAISKLRGASMMNGEFEKFAKSTAALSEKRNRVIHDPWCEDDDGSVTKTEVSARRLFKFEILESDIEQLRRLFSDILSHIQWLDKIFTEVDAMPEP
ncbi:hypothetical protein HUN39_13185 [Methylocystis sp. FS]|uniref:hypothetical protein n=1 Tax=Methylocystis silviterrae TaxID=2743612 RepID=UPI001583B81A|nr:hypothetical protein [Methylocystis silviterrae]NUJ80969.1 hypothetical protein [Methylocystis silviterrae]